MRVSGGVPTSLVPPACQILNGRKRQISDWLKQDFSEKAGAKPRHFDRACIVAYICVWAAKGLLLLRLAAA
jgi:hypothetical protein